MRLTLYFIQDGFVVKFGKASENKRNNSRFAAAAKAASTDSTDVTSKASLRILRFPSGRYDSEDGSRAVAIKR